MIITVYIATCHPLFPHTAKCLPYLSLYQHTKPCHQAGVPAKFVEHYTTVLHLHELLHITDTMKICGTEHPIHTLRTHCWPQQVAARQLCYYTSLYTVEQAHSSFMRRQDRFLAVQEHQVIQTHLVLGMAEAFGRRCSVNQAPVCPNGKVIGLPFVFIDVTVTSAMGQHLVQQSHTVRPVHALKMIHTLGAHQNSWLGIVRVLQSALPGEQAMLHQYHEQRLLLATLQPTVQHAAAIMPCCTARAQV